MTMPEAIDPLRPYSPLDSVLFPDEGLTLYWTQGELAKQMGYRLNQNPYQSRGARLPDVRYSFTQWYHWNEAWLCTRRNYPVESRN